MSSYDIKPLYLIKRSPYHTDMVKRIYIYFKYLIELFRIYFEDFQCNLVVVDNGDNVDHSFDSDSPFFLDIRTGDDGEMMINIAVDYQKSFCLDDYVLCLKIASLMADIGYEYFKINTSLEEISKDDLTGIICQQLASYILRSSIYPHRLNYLEMTKI